MHLSPAQYVIRLFGGVRATARAIGRASSSVSKWQKPRDGGGTDGGIPRLAQIEILKQAKKLGLDLKADDLLNGRTIKKSSKK